MKRVKSAISANFKSKNKIYLFDDLKKSYYQIISVLQLRANILKKENHISFFYFAILQFRKLIDLLS